MRVLILTAPVGEGHVAAARTLEQDIVRSRAGAEVTVCDVLPALRGPLRWLLSDAYRWQLHVAPWLFALLFSALRHSRVLRFLARAGLSLAGSGAVLRIVRRNPADVIVSTWPAATTILGCLRLRGKVRVPVCATITDFAGLELWADKGVDLHLVMHESLVPCVERLAGRDSARLVSPLVSADFLVPRSAGQARSALGLPGDRTLVVVSGGGWAVGDLEGAVRTALKLGDALVICLAGRNAATRSRLETTFAADPRVTVLGFTDSMSDLLAAADVLVHSTGGVTCLEALACGCPIVAYGAPPGHAPLLARQMAALGLVNHARTPSELRAALAASVRGPAPRTTGIIDAAKLVLAVAPRVTARRRSRWARTTATTAALAVALFTLMASDATYPLVAKASLVERGSVPTSGRSVALVVRCQRSDVRALVRLAGRDRLHASVVVSEPLAARDVDALRRSGLEPIPELDARGVASWFETRAQLETQVADYRLSGRFLYLAPKDGFTMGEYLLARHLGGHPIQPVHELPTGRLDVATISPGEVIVATLTHDSGHGRAHLVASIRQLERAGFAVSSIQRLVSGSSN